MSISGVNATDPRALFHQRRIDLKALTGAVEAGDTTAAQAALQNYQKDVQAVAAAAPSDSGSTSDLATRIKTDLSSLTSAVQSGDMTDAQAALAAYEQDKDPGADASSTQPADAASAFAQDLTKLIQAVQSGDTDGVQSSSTALAKDVQSLSQANGAGRTHHHRHHHHAEATSDTTNSTATTDSPLADAADSKAGAASETDPASAALTQFVKQFTEALEEAEQTQHKTV